MRYPGNPSRRIIFWLGTFSLAISVFIWLGLILAIARNPVDWTKSITGGALLTLIPIGLGIYFVRRGGRPISLSPQEATSSATKDQMETQSLSRAPSVWVGRLWFWFGVTLLSISAFIWLLLIPSITQGAANWVSLIVGGLIFTLIPIGLGIYCVKQGRKLTRTLESTPVRHVGVFGLGTPPAIKIERMAYLEKRIKVTKRKRSVASFCVAFGIGIITLPLAVLDVIVEVGVSDRGWGFIYFTTFFGAAFITLGFFAGRHYDGRLEQLEKELFEIFDLRGTEVS